MTLSDPLLKELKGHIGALVTSGPGPYSDDDEAVFLICHTLESIFLKGLIRHDGFTPWRTESFQWFHQLVRKYNKVLPLTFRGAFDDIMTDRKTRTNTGKTRLLIRHCLKRKCLHTPVQFHVEGQDYTDTSLRVNYNPNSSVLGHEILSQIFLSLVLQLSLYEFSFDLTNSSFLDESWQIPKLLKTELVPCDKLGLTLGFPMGFAVIVHIVEHSVAAEFSGQIEVGDIMDEFNGTPVRNMYGSKIESLFKKCKKRPFNITFIKSKDPDSTQIFLPAIKLYRILGMDPELLNYPEPAYRRRANNTQLTLDKTDIELDSDEPLEDELVDGNSNSSKPTRCDIRNTTHSSGQSRKKPEVAEQQLINVEVELEKPFLDEPENSTSYLDLLSSLVDHPASSSSVSNLDLLSSTTSNHPATSEQQSCLQNPQNSPPAQLILDSDDNLNESCSEGRGRRDEEDESGEPEPGGLEEPRGDGYYGQSKPSQYYDDSHPFVV